MDTPSIVRFFFELASMRRIQRSHRQFIHTAQDNISDHSFRVTIIGMMLASMESCNVDTVLRMCLFHDIVEIRTGDANLVHQQYSNLYETEARYDQLRALPMGPEIMETLAELEARTTRESLVAKDADLLDQMILQQEYLRTDPTNLAIWQNFTEKKLQTESAKRLAQDIRIANPFEWLYVLAEEKTGYTIQP